MYGKETCYVVTNVWYLIGAVAAGALAFALWNAGSFGVWAALLLAVGLILLIVAIATATRARADRDPGD